MHDVLRLIMQVVWCWRDESSIFCACGVRRGGFVLPYYWLVARCTHGLSIGLVLHEEMCCQKGVGWVGGWGRDNDVHVAVAHMVQVFGWCHKQIRVADVTRVTQHAASNTVSYIATLLEPKKMIVAGNLAVQKSDWKTFAGEALGKGVGHLQENVMNQLEMGLNLLIFHFKKRCDTCIAHAFWPSKRATPE